MRLINTTDFPDFFLRRMVSWCCNQLDMKTGSIEEAKFCDRMDGFTSGRAWGWRIHVSLGWPVYDGIPEGADRKQFVKRNNARRWYHSECYYRKYPHSVDQRIHDLVTVTAHELFHCYAQQNGINTRRHGKGRGSSEQQTIWHEKRVWESFKANRDKLLSAWMKEPAKRQAKPKASIQEKRAANVQKKLAEWQRKLKLAQTKLKKYKQQSRYYEKAIAAKSK